MRILLATQSLAGLGGSETYVVTAADHLQRLGHDVWLHALDHGRGSDHARSLGLRVVAGDHELPPQLDALIVQDSVIAPLLALEYPRTPQVFVAHSDIFDLQLPLQLPGMTAAVVTLYDRVDRRIRALATGHRIVRLSQPIDVERFKPRSVLPPRARTALTFGNYVHGTRLGLLERACARSGIELRHVGGYGPRLTSDPAGALNEVDVVFGKARAALEAMACGRAVYVYDHNGAEGWVTDANRALLAADNLGGQSQPIELDEDRLVADLGRYDAASGLANRDHVIAHNSATKHVTALVELLREVAGDPPPVLPDAPLRELSRLVRLHARADTQAFLLHAELERRDRRIHELDTARHEAAVAARDGAAAADAARADAGAARAEADAARAEADAARADADAAREQVAAARAEALRMAAEADDARRRLQTVAGSARWRATQRLLSPLDRARVLARRRTAPPPGAEYEPL